MKKTGFILLSIILVLFMTACANTKSKIDTATEQMESAVSEKQNTVAVSETNNNDGQDQNSSESNILIAYFTVPEDVPLDGVDAISGASKLVKDSEEYGNMEYLAHLIADKTNGKLFEIETVQEYPKEHSALIDFAKQEQSDGARPELKSVIDDADSYDIIFVGYPIWWADIPQPLYTFLESYDFSGKTIVLFSTHGGSRLANTVKTIAELQPGANVLENVMSIDRNSVVTTTQDEISAWIDSLGI